MNSPRRYPSPTEDGWNNWTDKQPEIANTLNDNNAIPTQEQKERFTSAPKMLQDTFTIQDDGSFLVKTPEESKVMEWHLKDLPIVPGIVLKRLFFHQTNTKAKGIVTTQFLWGVFAGQTITVRRDGIYTPAGKKVVDIILETQERMESPDHNDEISYQKMNQNPDDYLLQQHAFRFFSEGEKEGIMKDGTHFRGEYTIPEDFIRAEDGKISSEILEEIGAQIWAYVTGPDLNKNIPMIQTVENKTQLNSESKVFTFKLGKSSTTDIPTQTGEMVFVKGRVITFDPNGKEAHFCYTAENKDKQQLFSWEIKGNIVPVKMLIRAYGQVKNSAQK